jgi:uncharacterized protein YndB with AHSA1/START domain
MADATRVTVERRIDAPTQRIFEIVSDPNGHVQIDGSGMLVAAPDAKPMTQVGDTFDMNMDREPLGDFPEMGKYQVLNTVTQIEPGTLFEWNVGSKEHGPFGHVYGFVLTPAGDDATDVVHYCDWSGVPEEVRGVVQWPVVPVHMLEQTLEKLDQVATASV